MRGPGCAAAALNRYSCGQSPLTAEPTNTIQTTIIASLCSWKLALAPRAQQQLGGMSPAPQSLAAAFAVLQTWVVPIFKQQTIKVCYLYQNEVGYLSATLQSTNSTFMSVTAGLKTTCTELIVTASNFPYQEQKVKNSLWQESHHNQS